MTTRPPRPNAAERKREAIRALGQTRQELLEAVLALPASAHERLFLGVWGVKELVAHLVGWDNANQEAVQAIRAARLPAFYAHIDRDWAGFNAQLVAAHHQTPLSGLIAEARVAHAQLIALLEELPAADFTKDFGVRFRGYKVTIARLLAAETGDERTHTAQVQAFARQLEEEASAAGA